jgi:hypothetical protein
MDKLKEQLNSLVTPENLQDENIQSLSQQLDLEIVKFMKDGRRY